MPVRHHTHRKHRTTVASESHVMTAKSQVAKAKAELESIVKVVPSSALEKVQEQASNLHTALTKALSALEKLQHKHGSHSHHLLDHVPTEEQAAHHQSIVNDLLAHYHNNDDDFDLTNESVMDTHKTSRQGKIAKTQSDFTPSPEVEACCAGVGTFEFDALQLAAVTDKPITAAAVHMNEAEGIIASLAQNGNYIKDAGAFYDAFVRYLGHLDVLYKPTSVYHGSAHAVDVMSTLFWALKSEFFGEWVSAPDKFMSLVAASVHDVGHPGKNNAFYMKTWALKLASGDPNFALRYNDHAVLENYHVSLAFETLQKNPEADWFAMLSKADGAGSANLQGYMRRGITDMVLHTDMANHFKGLKELKDFAEQHHGHLETEEEMAKSTDQRFEDKLFILGSALHAMDISNPTKPAKICLAWTKRVLDEFWAQGDEEKSLGLPVTSLCDRDVESGKIPAGQLGFIGFVVEPYWKALASIIPEVQKGVDQLLENKAFWQFKKTEEENATYEKLFEGF